MGGDSTDRFAPQLGVGEVDLGDVAGARRGELAFRVAALTQQVERRRAVEQSGVEVRQLEMAGERLGDRPLAARRGPIDGDEDRKSVVEGKRVELGGPRITN